MISYSTADFNLKPFHLILLQEILKVKRNKTVTMNDFSIQLGSKEAYILHKRKNSV
jgi:hypothetical protein